MIQIDKDYTANEINSWKAGSILEEDDVALLRSASRMIKDSDDEWMRGYLICLSSTVSSHGASTAECERFNEVGRPSAHECRRLGLSYFDRKNISLIRKNTK